jgi:hypothetical protein
MRESACGSDADRQANSLTFTDLGGVILSRRFTARAETRYEGRTPVASEAERKLALARKIVSIARLRQLDMLDDVAEKLTVYADERTLSNLVKEIQIASSFPDALDAHSVTIPKNDNT